MTKNSRNQMPYSAILATFHSLQKQTAEAHMVYQQSMAQSHAAFLGASEKTFLAFAQMLSGQSVDVTLDASELSGIGEIEQDYNFEQTYLPPQDLSAAQPEFDWVQTVPTNAPVQTELAASRPSVSSGFRPSAPAVPSAPSSPKQSEAPRPAATAQFTASSQAPTSVPSSSVPSSGTATSPRAAEPTASTNGSSSAAAPVNPQTSTSGAEPANSQDVDITGLMLRVVADKTGYPTEMLASEMDLESDLGIDSIKRVEILSAIQDELQGSLVVDAQEMAALRTIGEIVGYIDDNVKKN